MDLAQLRKLKASTSNLSKLAQAAETTNGQREEDTTFWKLDRDKAGNGSATIRFLPNKDPEKLPWVKYFSHAFQGPTGKWYIENSLTTFNEPDPVGEANKELWDSGIEANKKLASARKRKLNYVSNIQVVKDPAHPENEGKVFKFKYGKQIFDMISEKLNPSFEDEEAVQVFDLWEGADLKLRIHMEDKFPKYTKSTWGNPRALAEDDEEILAIVNGVYELTDVLDRKNFKSYDDLKKRFESAIRSTSTVGTAAADLESNVEETEEEEVEAPVVKAAAKKAPKAKAKEAPAAVETEDDEDLAAFFKEINEE